MKFSSSLQVDRFLPWFAHVHSISILRQVTWEVVGCVLYSEDLIKTCELEYEAISELIAISSDNKRGVLERVSF